MYPTPERYEREAFLRDMEEDEPHKGRPPFYGEKMKQTAVWLPEEQITWLKNQSGTMSETIRKLISVEMEKESAK